MIMINSKTGDYSYTRCGPGGFTLTGKGSLQKVNSILMLSDIQATRRVQASFFTNQDRPCHDNADPGSGNLSNVYDQLDQSKSFYNLPTLMAEDRRKKRCSGLWDTASLPYSFHTLPLPRDLS
jgi:hypothetical protein